ncbi:enoyl-CoA hydratase [Bacillus sp. SA1-12]|uniref:enoyl-CoA hydratase n=1 Tax=Bacillus sp. SA1-12 TaxID=1455638 RepID=UPI000626FCFE|nr:enoyl-CoA hydratase [Bacillus sp. SA1-12]KKI90781.1 enoyl-CoA hydratase [Bacillus sp. SA1-12]
MDFKTVEFVKDGKTASLYLNRVDSLNAMDVQMIKELSEGLEEIAASDVKLLFISGRGRAFSAGGDLKTMLSSTNDEEFQPVMNDIKKMIMTLYTMPAVTVSLLNGAAAGLGLSFALACDYVMAEKNAKTAMNFINIGLIPDGGGHFFLKNRLGENAAKQLIWEGKSMTAVEALQAGVIDAVYEGDTEEQLELIKLKMGARPLKAMIASKAIFSKQALPLLIDTLNQEAKKQLEMRCTDDHREGVQAFLEKRVPQFNEN